MTTRPTLTLSRKPNTHPAQPVAPKNPATAAKPKKQAKPPKPPKAKVLPEPPKPDRSAVILAELMSLYPLAFTSPPLHPLEIGIIRKIPNVGDCSRRELRDTITQYCNDDAYLIRIVDSTNRINLEGATGSEITQEHRANAQAMLDGTLKRQSLKQGKKKKHVKPPTNPAP